ncbi:MAG: energy-coupled thiamine transporter ThiT [Solobacterium sp.]|nr:energy-coupled thiamine transporter ThiT [Solobacterium sp.]MCH4223309.1 energy-coupled thiamine transporter ThiT [Solobacterium sp.]
MKSSSRIRLLTYMALFIALYVVLEYAGMFIPFLQMPQGGSIELYWIPVFVASYMLGWQYGVIVAVVSWVVSFILGIPMYFVKPMQILLDYIAPLVVCGLASLYFKGKYKYYVGVTIAMVLKYVSQVLSGVYYWPPEDSVAGSSAAWIYSLGYNAWYNLATLVVCIILVPLLMKRLEKTNLKID